MIAIRIGETFYLILKLESVNEKLYTVFFFHNEGNAWTCSIFQVPSPGAPAGNGQNEAARGGEGRRREADGGGAERAGEDVRHATGPQRGAAPAGVRDADGAEGSALARCAAAAR